MQNRTDLDKLMRERTVHPFKKGYVTVDGYTFTQHYAEIKNDLDNLEVNEEDVWVCTFPKTGTTWTQEMVWMITNNLDFEKAQEDLDYRSPFVDSSIIFDDNDFMNNPDHKTLPFVHDSVGYYKTVKSPKVVKTHLPFDLLPLQIKNGVKKPKLICVIRHPKDTCVSYYHHSKLLEGFTGTFEEFAELFLAGKVNYGPYSHHILSYWNQRNFHNLLILKYEDMKKDLRSVIWQVSKFLNCSLNDDQVEILFKHLSFDTMKQNPAVAKNLVLNFATQWCKTNIPGGTFIRSGKSGDYKSLMSEEINKRFDEWIQRNFAETGFYV